MTIYLICIMKYDYIIAGAGLGGLSFVHHLLASNQEFSSVLIIDQKLKNINDRTWSFWLDREPYYECAYAQLWKRLGFATDDYVHFESIDPYTYYTIHSHEFYNEVFAKINKDSRIEFLKDNVKSIIPEAGLVKVTTTGDTYIAGYVIDSITHPVEIPTDTLMLAQNFVGWTISTSQAAFDIENPILMDFRVSQQNAPSFVYLLPYSESKALVEYTQFSASFSYDQKVYESELHQYIGKQLKIADFTVLEKEDGSIPMTNFEFDSRPHERIFRIGTVSGDTKPTTGYTFVNVQKHAIDILKELSGEQPETTDNSRFRFYDTLLLQIMLEQPALVKTIMKFLFKNQPMSRVLKFLDEETVVLEEMLIMGQLPWKPFLSTLFKRSQRVFT